MWTGVPLLVRLVPFRAALWATASCHAPLQAADRRLAGVTWVTGSLCTMLVGGRRLLCAVVHGAGA